MREDGNDARFDANSRQTARPKSAEEATSFNHLSCRAGARTPKHCAEHRTPAIVDSWVEVGPESKIEVLELRRETQHDDSRIRAFDFRHRGATRCLFVFLSW